MNSSFQIDPRRAVRLMRFAALTVASCFGLAAATFGGIALNANSNAGSDESRSKSIDLETSEVRRVLSEARSKDAVRVRTQSKAIADFQEHVARFAHANHCNVEEFIAGTEAQPFLTRFEKQSQIAGWSQIEVQMLLKGNPRDVSQTIFQLTDQPVPIEFNSIQMLREGIDEQTTVLKAKVQLRVLVQAPGATP